MRPTSRRLHGRAKRNSRARSYGAVPCVVWHRGKRQLQFWVTLSLLLCLAGCTADGTAKWADARLGGLTRTVIREQGIPAAEAALGSLKKTSARDYQHEQPTAVSAIGDRCPYCSGNSVATSRETGANVCENGHEWGGMLRSERPDPYAAYRAALASGKPFDVLIVGEGCPGCEAVKKFGHAGHIELMDYDPLGAQILVGDTIPQLVRYNAAAKVAARFTGPMPILEAWFPRKDAGPPKAPSVCPCGCGKTGCECGKEACQSSPPTLRVRRKR